MFPCGANKSGGTQLHQPHSTAIHLFASPLCPAP
jgi:hypothetical protein